jgi:hypothetical protein
LLAPRAPEQDPAVPYWLDRRGAIGRGFGLIELCEQCERGELWIDPVPNAQLMLIQLLDYVHSLAKLAPKDALAKWTPAAVEVSGTTLKSPAVPGEPIDSRRRRTAPISWPAISACCRNSDGPC